MLTVRQLLLVSEPQGEELHVASLLAQYRARPLSVKSAAAAYERQRFVVFVSLVSARVLTLPAVHSMDDLTRAAQGPDGQMSGPEILALSSALRDQGLSLRLLDPDRRRAVIIGNAPSLVNAPATEVNNTNLLKVQDKYAAVEAGGGVVAGFGLFLMGAGAPVAGAAVFGFGAGLVFGAALMDYLHDTSPAHKSDSQETTPVLDDLGPDGPADQTLDVPNAVAIGDAPGGFNVEGVLTQIGDFAIDFAVDMVISDLPVGIDPVSGDFVPGGEGDVGGGEDGGLLPVG